MVFGWSNWMSFYEEVQYSSWFRQVSKFAVLFYTFVCEFAFYIWEKANWLNFWCNTDKIREIVWYQAWDQYHLLTHSWKLQYPVLFFWQFTTKLQLALCWQRLLWISLVFKINSVIFYKEKIGFFYLPETLICIL